MKSEVERLGSQAREMDRGEVTEQLVHWAKKLGIHFEGNGYLSTEAAAAIFMF